MADWMIVSVASLLLAAALVASELVHRLTPYARYCPECARETGLYQRTTRYDTKTGRPAATAYWVACPDWGWNDAEHYRRSGWPKGLDLGWWKARETDD